MWWLNFFDSFKIKKENPKIRGFSLWNTFNIDYNISPVQLYSFYKNSPYLTSVINKIKSDVWGKWIELQIKKWGDYVVTDDIDFVNLLSYQNPTQKISIKSFLEKIVKDVEICGNAYVFFQKDNNKVIWIKRLDAKYMTPVVRDTGEVIWYIQNLNWIRAYLPDEVFHFKDNDDVNDETIWEAKMISLFTDLETDKEARESNLAFFKNNQTPSSIVILDPEFEFSSEDQVNLRNEIKEIFNSWNYTGWKNHYRTSLIQWVKEVVKVQDKIDDMKFIMLRRLTMQLCCAVYWVPQDLIWFTETSNRSVWDVQYDIYIDSIISKENKYEQFLSIIVKYALWEQYRVVILQDNLRNLEKKSAIAWKLYKDYWIITLNEAREIVQYTEEKWEEWSKYFKSGNEEKTKEATK